MAELRASSQSLLQKLNDEKHRNEDLLSRVKELVSQLYQKENQLYAYRLNELGATIYILVSLLTAISLTLLVGDKIIIRVSIFGLS